MPDPYQRAGDLFHAALELPADDRRAFVASACAGDEELRRDVESLLAAHRDADRFIERPAMQIAAALIAADSDPVAPAARIGRYEIVSLIARGGMGEVYRARDLSLGREVALKLPRRPYAVGLDAVRRFEHEARAASSLNHPNIVTVHEIGEAGGRQFIAMELVDGQPLASMIGQPPPRPALARIGRQLAEALAVAHGAGIVHGDVKPENIMVRADGYVKVLDFGVARLASSVSDGATGPVAVAAPLLGTPRYMAPEQARGDAATAASDVFACGVVLYELATARHPFIAETTRGPWRTIEDRERVSPSRQEVDLPQVLESLLLRMLEKLPGARPTARDVEAAFVSLESTPPERWGHSQDLNLPPQRTGFVGRSAERAALAAMLLNHSLRLTTLTGPGGTGKTRLALETVPQVAPRFSGGVSFVNLAPAVDARSVVAAVARAHAVPEERGRALVETLAEHLRGRGAALLVLDNFEHVIAAAPLIQDLLDSCPALTVMVTSRVVLHLYGEQEFPVAPLTLPEAAGAPPDQLMRAAAIELFVQRAAAVQPGFVLNAANGRAVAEICRRVDGLPLAIELAAARVKILPPQELLTRLDRRLDLLTGGPRDVPARQQTLRSTIDWSYDLLSPAEQTLFRRLAVFAGGCSLDAVEAVCNASEDLAVDVLGGVTALVDNSLLTQRASADGHSRFVMLETIREYARERLDESGETAATALAHAAYGLVLAEEGLHETGPADREAWLRSCDVEHDNLRAAIAHLVAIGHAEWALRLAIALFRFWEWREHLTEGRESFAAVLASPGATAPAQARTRALYYAGVLAYSQHDYENAAALIREAHELSRQTGDAAGEATTKSALAWQIVQLGGSHLEAQGLLEEAAALWEQLGDGVTADKARSNLANVAKAAGNQGLASALLERVIAASNQRGDIRSVATALNALGDLAASFGDPDTARRRHHESLLRFRQIDDRAGIARALADLANLDVVAGDLGAATRSLVEALVAFQRTGHQRGVARQLEMLAWCAAGQSRPGVAVTLASAAAAIRQRIRVPIGATERGYVERALEDARSKVSDTEYEHAWSAGRDMTAAELAALAHGSGELDAR